jgi:heme exporter protein CcmD
MMHWLEMGGYWPYIWPSYGLTLLTVWLNVHFARKSLRDARRDALRRQQMTGEPR